MKKNVFLAILASLLLSVGTAWAGESNFDKVLISPSTSEDKPALEVRMTGGAKVATSDPWTFFWGSLECQGASLFTSTVDIDGLTTLSGSLIFDGTDSVVDLPEIAASGTPGENIGRLYVGDNGGTTTLYFRDSVDTVTNLLTAGASAWDDVTDPDANSSVTFGTYTNTFTGASIAADQFNFLNTGNFGDVSVVKIQQLTGNPTDGTMLEVTAADTNVDGVVISNTTADLTADSTLLTLSLTDDGDANGIFLNCLDNAGVESKFLVGADGNTTIAGTLGVTGVATVGGLSGGAVVIDLTNFDVSAAGALATVSGAFSGDLTVGGTASVGTLKMDSLIPAGAAPQAIALNGAGAGGVNIGNVSTGAVGIGATASAITLGADTTVADGKNVTIGEGSLVVDNDAVDETAVAITSDATTTGGAISVVAKATTTKVASITADDLGTGGMMVYLDSDNIAADNYYIYAYDGTNPDFTVSANGATVIAGAASTDMLTVTAGDVQITAGDIDLDNGQLMVDTTQDLSNNISRNFAGAGTGAVLVVNDDHTSSTNIALDVNQDGTGASTGVRVVHDGTNPALAISAGAARTGDVINIDMANQLADRALNITGAITSVAGGGTIEVHGTGVIPATASLCRLDADTAQPGDGDGWMLNVDDDTLVVATPSHYAVLIDSNANEALHVATGKALFDEAATFTSGVVANGDLAVTFSDNTEEALITATAADYAADSAILAIVGSAGAGQTNASYLLQLDRNADGDAEDHFIRCRDNAYADTKFAVDSGGAVTAAGAVTATGVINANGGIIAAKEVRFKVGTPIASPGGGELTLGDGTYFSITGVNNITSIAAASSTAGRMIVLNFADILTFTDGGNLKLAGNYVTTADDTITLMCDGTNWYEMARSAN